MTVCKLHFDKVGGCLRKKELSRFYDPRFYVDIIQRSPTYLISVGILSRITIMISLPIVQATLTMPFVMTENMIALCFHSRCRQFVV